MKPTTLFFSLLGAIGVSAVSAIPSFAQITSVPITGGNFSVTDLGTSAIFNGTALTSIGTIIFSSATGGRLTIPAIPTPPNRDPVAGDIVNVVNLITSGTIAGQPFTNALLSGTGTIQSFTFTQQPPSQIFRPSYVITGTSGTIQLPTSLVSSLSGGTTSGTTGGTTEFNSPISRLIAVNEESARRIFNAQPVLESSRNFLPSRIHPDLGR